MWHQHDIFEFSESWRDLRLVLEDVQSGAGNPALLQGLNERRLVHYRATRRIDQIRARAHQTEFIGPNEVRRFLGQDVADAVTLQGSQVIVQAQVPARTFYAEGRWHTYHDGMHGTAEVRVRSQRIVFALVPGLKAVFEGKHGENERPPSAR